MNYVQALTLPLSAKAPDLGLLIPNRLNYGKSNDAGTLTSPLLGQSDR